MDDDIQDFDNSRQAGIGRMFLLARRDFVARLNEKLGASVNLQALGGGSALLPYIDAKGTRSTDIAVRAGISRQAVAKALQKLEDAELVSRVVDPQDARINVVYFTAQGLKMLGQLQTAVRQVEADYENRIGVDSVQQLKKALSALYTTNGGMP